VPAGVLALLLLSAPASAGAPAPDPSSVCVPLRRWARGGEGLSEALQPLRAAAAETSCRGAAEDARAARLLLDAWQASHERDFLRGARARLACLRGPDAPAAAPRALSALARGAGVLDSSDDLAAALLLAGAPMPKDAAGRAFRVEGLLDLYEASFDPGQLDAAVELGAALAREARALAAAEAEAAGAGASALLRLAWLTDRKEFRKAAKTVLERHPRRREAGALLCAAEFAAAKPLQIVLAAADAEDAGLREMLRLVHSRYRPDRLLLVAAGDERRLRLARHMPFARGARPVGGKATAYVCHDGICDLPVADLGSLAGQLGDAPPGAGRPR
jgi:uncharacterized protein YyaL (SSP411 family)